MKAAAFGVRPWSFRRSEHPLGLVWDPLLWSLLKQSFVAIGGFYTDPCSRWVCSRSGDLWSPRGGQTQGAGRERGRQCRAQLPPCQLLVTLNICYLFQCFFIFIKYLAKNHLCSCQTLGEQPCVAAVTLNVGFVDPFLFCSWFLERWEEGDQQQPSAGASQPFPDGYGQE